MSECGRNQKGYLLCWTNQKCSDCPLNNPISETEKAIVAERKANE